MVLLLCVAVQGLQPHRTPTTQLARRSTAVMTSARRMVSLRMSDEDEVAPRSDAAKRGAYFRREAEDWVREERDRRKAPDNIDEIRELIGERRILQRERKYREADSVLAVLNGMDIHLDDVARTWGSHASSNYVTQDGVSKGAEYAFKGGSKQLKKLPEGRVEAINFLVARRFENKKTLDFLAADSVEAELLRDYGVIVDDTRRLWALTTPRELNYTRAKADDILLRVPGSSEVSLTPEGSRYDAASNATICTPEEEQAVLEVSAIVERRRKLKLTEDWAGAEALTEDLEDRFGVIIDDRKRCWFVVTDTPHNYRRLGPYSSDEDAVDDLITERTLARDAKNFKRADEIVSILESKHRVELFDADRFWTDIDAEIFRKKQDPTETTPTKAPGSFKKQYKY